MAIKIKVASTAKELDDVFKLRYEVYVVEDGKFGNVAGLDQRIVDRFDAIPQVANVIAYSDGEAVGALRVNLDTGVGLPSDEYYDFHQYRLNRDDYRSNNTHGAKFASAGMLAIREKWRNRRDVTPALFKMATGVCHSWFSDYVITTANHETVSVYKHLGFEAIDEALWVESIGNKIVPMCTPFDRPYQWAFGKLLNTSLDKFWLDSFSQHFERILLTPGEKLFDEGDKANNAFIVDNGWLTVSRRDEQGEELTLATLSAGALLGELSLIDEGPRSATVVACTNCELIVLNKNVFDTAIREKGHLSVQLSKMFAERIRRTDDLVMVLAFAPQTGRVMFALNDLRKTAIPDKKGNWVVKVGPERLAASAGVREFEVLRVLEQQKQAGYLEYGRHLIRFLG